ncbi:MAG: 2-phosphosulfolactate phosphatase [Ignavibacteriae bacterium]|nr:2-phosphosulfolactate phosphatase [Ignavibacteriota bacterium]
MKINTLLTPLSVDELYFTKKNVVVIDVLRATTTIVTALKNGAKEIIPVSSVEFAMTVSGNSFKGHTLLGGERNTLKIEGFALGNSPLEYIREIVEGKSIVLFTTNGSKAIVKAKYATNLIIASFLNANAIKEKMLENNEDWEILCSGNNGKFSYEDSVCAGMIISQILDSKEDIFLDDSSKTCKIIFDKHKKKLSKMLAETEHGQKLIESGFKEDLNFASQQNIFEIVPFYQTGVIKTTAK